MMRRKWASSKTHPHTGTHAALLTFTPAQEADNKQTLTHLLRF